MKRSKKIIAVALSTAVCLGSVFCFTGCQSNGEKAMKTVRLCEVTHSLFYAPQYVAMSQGFFEDEGIDVELTNGGGADKVMAAVLSNNIDIGLAGPEACIYVYKEGKEDYPMVFSQLTKRDGSFLISREPAENFQWSDLQNKTVIPGRKGGVPYMTLSHVIKENGLTPGVDVTLDDSIQFDLMASAFSNGSADYVTLFEPTASAVIQSGKGYYAASVGQASGEIPYTAYFSKQSYIEENADVIQGFANAVAKGQQWVATHSAQEIAEAIVGEFPDTGLETLTAGVQSYKDIDAWNATPVMAEESFNRLQQVMLEAGELDQTVPFDQLVTNKFSNNAK